MTQQEFESVLLCSGGLDSTTLAYWLRERGVSFVPLFLDYGQHCAHTERSRLARVLPEDAASRVVTVDVSDVYRGTESRLISEPNLWHEEVEDKDLYLPYRNLFMLTAGAAYAQARGIGKVYAAFINSSHAREIDCSAAFFNSLGDLLKDYGAIEIEMPFREMSKKEVAQLGISLGAPIALTFSCQLSSSTPCGACPNCVERLDALADLA